MLVMTMQEKRKLMEMLSIVFQDSEFLSRANYVNEHTIRITEEFFHQLNFCNKATSALLAGVQCFPKSKNVYGWLVGCISALANLIKMNEVEFKSNMFCSAHVIFRYKSFIKETLL